MARHHGKFLVFALSAVFGLFAGEVQAETITFTIIIPGHTLDLTAITTPSSTNPSQGATVDTAALNALLTADGSAYQFNSLGGGSNFPGSSTSGSLTLGGSVFTMATGSTSLQIIETEGGFTAPTGPTGSLSSSTSGTFTQAVGGSSTAHSMFNSTATSPLTLTATTDNQSLQNGNSTGLAPVSTLYTLTNTISFALPLAAGTNVPTDSFGVGAVVTSVIPEPGSIILMLTGMPLPLVVMGLFRRRRRQVA